MSEEHSATHKGFLFEYPCAPSYKNTSTWAVFGKDNTAVFFLSSFKDKGLYKYKHIARQILKSLQTRLSYSLKAKSNLSHVNINQNIHKLFNYNKQTNFYSFTRFGS